MDSDELREALAKLGIDAWEVEHHKNLSNEEAGAEILRLESFIDEHICEPRSWDLYFCLMHECDERGLIDDFRRIRSKIDTSVYKPHESTDPGVILVLRERIAWQRELRKKGLI